ncbi:helix-turn-helix domain-containing protein [Hoeflea ulvae]|uniref:Helix-turn-helix domain-containing protein n=1 Tax=Hoeflea ulvae TaxID=2983764 RepID=A0ABT3YJE2_9HYPH|nr:helix-turn-helix domain-containing protein [Hoeflea ulvae]MCY0095732.1 helix-turn-helix domain-containing protein [Hoeflea ulvae]
MTDGCRDGLFGSPRFFAQICGPGDPEEDDTIMDLGNEGGFHPLTRTEMKCLRRCAEGRTDTQIGAEMELTAGEVKSVLSVIMMKLRVPNRMAGMAKAARLGLLELQQTH